MPILSMAKTVVQNLFKKPATISIVNPKPVFERTRGHIEIDIDACIFCGICSRKCPTGAIAVDRNEKNWAIERFKCIQCNSCVDNCPKKCLNMDNKQTGVSQVMVKDVINLARVSDNAGDNQNI